MANTISANAAILPFKGKVPAAKLSVLEVASFEGTTTAALLKAAAECQVTLTGASVKANTKITAYNEGTKELTLSQAQTGEITTQSFNVPASLGILQSIKATGTYTFTAGEWSTFSLTGTALPAGLYLEEGPGFTAQIGGVPTAGGETTGIKVKATATEGGLTAETASFAIVVENSKFLDIGTAEVTLNTVDASNGAVGSFSSKPGTVISNNAQAEVSALNAAATQGLIQRLN